MTENNKIYITASELADIPVWEDRMARLKIEEENAEKKMCSYRTDNVLIEPS